MTVQVLTFTQVARFSFILSFILKKYNNIKYKIKKSYRIEVGQNETMEGEEPKRKHKILYDFS